MARRSYALWAWLLVWAVAVGGSRRLIDRHFEWRYPPLNTLVATPEFATDVSIVIAGAHRLAADVAYIQFLQYYGMHQHSEDDGHTEAEHEHIHDFAGGAYVRLLEFGRRILRLDPYFHSAVLDVAGSLAFNQKRTDESLSLLREAIDLDPMFYRYRLYTAAILYKNEGKDDQLINMLAEAIKFPDCPWMFKNILANLLVKKGLLLQAAQVRIHMIQTAAIASDRELAERKLLEILQKDPQIRQKLGF